MTSQDSPVVGPEGTITVNAGLRWEPIVDVWDALLERVVADAANKG